MSRVLGWYLFPEPEGTCYGEEELKDPEVVKELFGYCGLWYALISQEGWDFLLEVYGLERLYQIDHDSLWHDSLDLTQFAADVAYERGIAPKTFETIERND